MAICHGDFHAGNIFINHKNGVASLIDYGDIKKAPMCYDAISLELGFFFNKDSKIQNWPDIYTASKWANNEEYFLDCPHADKISSIRDWAISLANNEKKEVIAVAYCYLIRQLKYENIVDSKGEETIAMLNGLLPCFNN